MELTHLGEKRAFVAGGNPAFGEGARQHLADAAVIVTKHGHTHAQGLEHGTAE